MAAEIGHDIGKLAIRAPLDQRAGRRVAEVLHQPPAPRGRALEHQRRIELVRTLVDPVLQDLAARLGESLLLQRAVFEDDHVPTEGTEQRLVARPQPFAHDRIKALAVVVDDPPAIAQALLPALEQGLEYIAFVEFGIANERDHPPFRMLSGPAVRAHVILNQRGEQCLRHAEPDRAGGEVDVIVVLGARWIALRAAEGAEALQPRAALAPKQILDRVIDRARVRLDRDAILRSQNVEIECRHDGGEGRGRGLMAADLQTIRVLAQMVGVVDGPGREPQHLALQRAQDFQVVRVERGRVGHGCTVSGYARFYRSKDWNFLPKCTTVSLRISSLCQIFCQI